MFQIFLIKTKYRIDMIVPFYLKCIGVVWRSKKGEMRFAYLMILIQCFQSIDYHAHVLRALLFLLETIHWGEGPS